MWTVTNCYLDASKRMLQRVAARLDSEPLVGGRRLCPRDSIKVTQEYVERNHADLERHVKNGVLVLTAPTGQVIDKPAIESHPDVIDDLAPEAPAPVEQPAAVIVSPAPTADEVVEKAAEPVDPTPDPGKTKKHWRSKG